MNWELVRYPFLGSKENIPRPYRINQIPPQPKIPDAIKMEAEPLPIGKPLNRPFTDKHKKKTPIRKAACFSSEYFLCPVAGANDGRC
jgi:hypothetical protein